MSDKCNHRICDRDRIRQGDIIRNVRYFESFYFDGDYLDLSYIDFPYALVLTQDCDLANEKKGRLQNEETLSVENNSVGLAKLNIDKSLISVLLAPIYNYSKFETGDHLALVQKPLFSIKCELKSWEPSSSRTRCNIIKQNNDPRYHFISMQDNSILPDSVIDFKHYFSVSLQKLEKLGTTNYVCTVEPLWREKISQRFASFLSRIGLPVIQ